MAGFIHHVGMLTCIFDDWLDTAHQATNYCQAFVAFNPAGTQSKSGHILALSASAKLTFEDFHSQLGLTPMNTFGTQVIWSTNYLQ